MNLVPYMQHLDRVDLARILRVVQFSKLEKKDFLADCDVHEGNLFLLNLDCVIEAMRHYEDRIYRTTESPESYGYASFKELMHLLQNPPPLPPLPPRCGKDFYQGMIIGFVIAPLEAAIIAYMLALPLNP